MVLRLGSPYLGTVYFIFTYRANEYLLPLGGFETVSKDRAHNIKASRPLQFFVLAPLLRQEAMAVDLQVWLVEEHKQQRFQRKAYATVQGKLFALWAKYDNQAISTAQLLLACAHTCLHQTWIANVNFDWQLTVERLNFMLQ